jgi:hypothetical protein
MEYTVTTKNNVALMLLFIGLYRLYNELYVWVKRRDTRYQFALITLCGGETPSYMVNIRLIKQWLIFCYTVFDEFPVKETISIEIYSRPMNKTPYGPYGVSYDESPTEISLVFFTSILLI